MRDAKTIWAAAALITVSGEARREEAIGAADNEGVEIIGSTGPVVSGGSPVVDGTRPPPQQAAR